MPRKNEFKHTSEEIIQNIKTIYTDIKHVPTMQEYINHPAHIYSITAIRNQLGTWKNALKAAGLCRSSIVYSNRELIKNLKLVSKKIGHTPSPGEYIKHPDHKYSYTTFKHRFKHWYIACEKAGFPRCLRAISVEITRDQVIQNVKDISEELGYFPSQSEVEQHPKYRVSKTTLRKFFNPYNLLAKEIGIEYTRKRRISDEELLEDLYNAATSHPDASMMMLLKKYTLHGEPTFKRFGNFNQIRQKIYQKYGLKIIDRSNDVKKSWWTKQIIKDEFYYVKSIVGRTPFCTELSRYSHYKCIAHGIQRLYGNYTNFLLSINHIPIKHRNNSDVYAIKKKIYIKELRRIIKNAEKTKTVLSVRQIVKESNILKRNMIIKLFGSAKQWFDESHIPYYINKKINSKNKTHRTDMHPIVISDEELLYSIQNVAKNIGHTPTQAEYQKNNNRISCVETIRKRFGIWENAMIAAGLTPIKRKNIMVTSEQILESIQKVVEDLKRIPREMEYEKHPYGICTNVTIQKYFGSWKNALSLLNLYPIHVYKYSYEDMIERIRAVAEDIGHVPTKEEYRLNPQKYIAKASIYKYFGSWSKALEAAGLKEKSAS